MPNQYVQQRLAGIQQILMGVHAAGAPMSNTSKGAEQKPLSITGSCGVVVSAQASAKDLKLAP
jgi:hypothetical protein